MCAYYVRTLCALPQPQHTFRRVFESVPVKIVFVSFLLLTINTNAILRATENTSTQQPEILWIMNSISTMLHHNDECKFICAITHAKKMAIVSLISFFSHRVGFERFPSCETAAYEMIMAVAPDFPLKYLCELNRRAHTHSHGKATMMCRESERERMRTMRLKLREFLMCVCVKIRSLSAIIKHMLK